MNNIDDSVRRGLPRHESRKAVGTLSSVDKGGSRKSRSRKNSGNALASVLEMKSQRSDIDGMSQLQSPKHGPFEGQRKTWAKNSSVIFFSSKG
jgi:hypothetical protein